MITKSTNLILLSLLAIFLWEQALLMSSVDAFTISSSALRSFPVSSHHHRSLPILSSDVSNTLEPSIDVSDKNDDTSDIRPLHQNWWAATATVALDKSRPNAIELLGMRLVLFYDEGDKQWKCLEDMCQHRFAPLSEGRIVKNKCSSDKTCIQCAYHGWEFNSEGSCTLIPQKEYGTKSEEKVSPVRSFPVREDVGIIWVWTDPDTKAFSECIPLPISPLLRRHHQVHGDECAYMRDLPYGYELLGENLLDLSHLPFAHHSVGGLNREIGGALPLRMLSEREKKMETEWELEYEKKGFGSQSTVLPRYQVEVVDAIKHDPFLVGAAKSGRPVPDDSTCTIAFHEPSHVRYRRQMGYASHVELFMTPTRAGHSRVVLFNAGESMLPPWEPKNQKSFKSRITALSPASLKAALLKKMIVKLFDPTKHRSHMFNHQIFDGDGIFLNKQGDRMRRRGLSYKDYATPTTADVMINAFRRYLNKATIKADEAGHTMASSSVSFLNGEQYIDNDIRPELLDRYESHTKNCPVCSKALEKSERWHRRWDLAQTAFVGAAGSSTTVFAAACTLSLLGTVSIPTVLFSTSGIASLSTVCGATIANRKKKKLDGTIKQFYFEDYVHAEKD